MVPLNLTITFENMLTENVKKQTWISSQKGMGWLSKNFDIQGAVFFCEWGNTCGMPSKQKCAATQQIELFA
jgi:hypothetical protein